MFTSVPDKAVNDPFTEAMWDTYIRDNLNAGVLRPIAEYRVLANTATLDFTSIAADWSHLLLITSVRQHAAGAVADMNIRFNGDAGNHYRRATVKGVAPANATPDLTDAAGVGMIALRLYAVGTGYQTGLNLSGAAIWIPNYANTARYKTLMGLHAAFSADDSSTIAMTSGKWEDVSAITAINLSLSANQFGVDSRATLYGLGGI